MGESSLDNDGTGRYCQTAWARQARRRGVRMQKPVVEPPQEVAPARNLVDRGRDGSASVFLWSEETDSRVDGGKADPGGHGEGLRRSRGEGCRGKAGRRSRQPVGGERGNRRRVASLPAGQAGSGKARRLLMARRRDGVLVVVAGVTPRLGGRESRPQGEGGQRVRSCEHGISGGRR